MSRGYENWPPPMDVYPSSSNARHQHPPHSESEGGSTDGDLDALTPSRSGGDGVTFRRPPPEIVTAVYDYSAKKDDELTLRRGSRIEVVSKDATVSGDEGWWAGKLEGQYGVFPSNFVQTDVAAALSTYTQNHSLPQISWSELKCEDLIGSGGFGRVFRASYRGGPVAVKIAHVVTAEDEAEAAVRQEGALFHLLNHRNIVALMGVCLERTHLSLVLEYCAGGSLTNLLSGKNIPADVLIDWSLQVAEGMYYLHDIAPVPLVHRDLKSANVLVKESVCSHPAGHHSPGTHCGSTASLRNLTLKITDFGLAREACRTTRASVCGTYAWMAPEVLKNTNAFSKSSDVYSYGVLLWELLTGDTPYRGLEPLAVAFSVATGKLSLHIPSTCPKNLSDIMSQCWAPDPSTRPSFKELLAQLRDLDELELGELDDSSFHSLQEDWRREIEALLHETKEREAAVRKQETLLKSRQEEMALEARRQEEYAAELGKWEEDIRNREKELLVQELSILLFPSTDDPQPQPRQRHGRFQLSRMWQKKKTPKREDPSAISSPKDFKHLLTVRSGGSRASSESPPCSPKGGPGTSLQVLLPSSEGDELGAETGVSGGTWGPAGSRTSSLARDRPSLPQVARQKHPLRPRQVSESRSKAAKPPKARKEGLGPSLSTSTPNLLKINGGGGQLRLAEPVEESRKRAKASLPITNGLKPISKPRPSLPNGLPPSHPPPLLKLAKSSDWDDEKGEQRLVPVELPGTPRRANNTGNRKRTDTRKGSSAGGERPTVVRGLLESAYELFGGVALSRDLRSQRPPDPSLPASRSIPGTCRVPPSRGPANLAWIQAHQTHLPSSSNGTTPIHKARPQGSRPPPPEDQLSLDRGTSCSPSRLSGRARQPSQDSLASTVSITSIPTSRTKPPPSKSNGNTGSLGRSKGGRGPQPTPQTKSYKQPTPTGDRRPSETSVLAPSASSSHPPAKESWLSGSRQRVQPPTPTSRPHNAPPEASRLGIPGQQPPPRLHQADLGAIATVTPISNCPPFPPPPPPTPATPGSHANPGYEAVTLPERATKRPDTLPLASRSIGTPPESGISTAGSSFLSFSADGDKGSANIGESSETRHPPPQTRQLLSPVHQSP